MAEIPQKRNFYGITSGKIKAFVFIILVGVAIAFWLYTQSIFSQVREFHRGVVKKQVSIYLSIIDPQSTFDSGIDQRLFENVILNVPYPGIFTDENMNPDRGNWHNVGIAPDDTSEVSQLKLRKLVKKMDAVNPPEQFFRPSLEIRTDTCNCYRRNRKLLVS